MLNLIAAANSKRCFGFPFLNQTVPTKGCHLVMRVKASQGVAKLSIWASTRTSTLTISQTPKTQTALPFHYTNNVSNLQTTKKNTINISLSTFRPFVLKNKPQPIECIPILIHFFSRDAHHYPLKKPNTIFNLSSKITNFNE